MAKIKKSSKKTAKQGDVYAIFSYFGVLCLIPLLARKDNEFAQFHAKQGLILFIAEVVTFFVQQVPVVGWFIGAILWVAWIGLSIIGMINASQNKKEPLPFIGELSDKLNI